MKSLKNALAALIGVGVGGITLIVLFVLALAVKIGVLALLIYGVMLVLEWLGADLPYVILALP